MKYSPQSNVKLIIFDFDGTITDTSEGILDVHRFVLNTMGREVPSEEELCGVIGANLLTTYMEKFGFADLDARVVVRIYRERYAEVGIYKAILYPSFVDMITNLKNKGYKIGGYFKSRGFCKEYAE